jgi:hypothetical protein
MEPQALRDITVGDTCIIVTKQSPCLVYARLAYNVRHRKGKRIGVVDTYQIVDDIIVRVTAITVAAFIRIER